VSKLGPEEYLTSKGVTMILFRFHVGDIKDAKKELIDPAVEGTLSILKAAKVQTLTPSRSYHSQG
jgi:hypothetical protein